MRQPSVKIRVLWPGRTRASHYKSAIEDYAGRIRKLSPFEIVETRERALRDKQRDVRISEESRDLQARVRPSVAVYFDPGGKAISSEELARWLQNHNAQADFILGGPEGCWLPEKATVFSFGRITLPHELARVVLLEQIYRALTILRKIPYHK